MFETVLLPTDFSPDSQRILGYVKDIFGVKKVLLLHVVDATRPSRRGMEHGSRIENAKILLDETRQVLAKNGIPAEITVDTIIDTITQGDIPYTILEKAERENASLIMMGARGKNAIQDILLGSVSANVIRRAKCPVLLMRFPPDFPAAGEHRHLFSRVLVPVDFSGPSKQALDLLKAIPGTGHVILLHCIDKGESEEEIQAAVTAARKNLQPLEQTLRSAGIEAEVRVYVGYPPHEINATAERDDVTLILMSPHGEGWSRELRTLFIGSTTNAVIRRAHRPVLITGGPKIQ